MEKLLNFLRDYINIRRESKSFCKSCETYKEQLAIANFEKKQLLDRVLHVPEPARVDTPATPQPIAPRMMPFRIQREMLEAEDRAKAKTLRTLAEEQVRASSVNQNHAGDPIETKSISIEELEKELEIEVH